MEEFKKIELTSETGEKLLFEVLDYIQEEEKEYAILNPTFDDEGVYIVEIKPGYNDATSEYVVVTDHVLANKIFEKYKNSNPSGIIFED